MMIDDFKTNLRVEIALKMAYAAMMEQRAHFLETVLAAAEAGMSEEEIRASMEHDPFEDYGMFNLKKGNGTTGVK